MSDLSKVIIIGAGFHGIVIADALIKEGKSELWGFSEKDEVVEGGQRCKLVANELSFPIFSDHEIIKKNVSGIRFSVILGIGAEQIEARKKIGKRLKEDQFSFCTVIHPFSAISPSAVLGEGVVVMAGCVINPFAVIGDHAVINTGVTLDHGCVIGENVFVQPGAHLAGNVHVGNGTIIGIGASVKQGVNIGCNSIVGGGAFVNRDVPNGVVYVGVPARKLR